MSSALIVNEPKVKSEDVEPHSVVKKEENDGEVFYTLEELDDLENQFMAYIARKFSISNFKKNKAFKPRKYICISSNNTRLKSPYKSGYKTGFVDRSK